MKNFLSYFTISFTFLALGFCDSNESCSSDSATSSKCNQINENEEYFQLDPSLNELEQDDPMLIEAIKRIYLQPPSKKPYNFTNNAKVDMNGQFKQPLIVDSMLRGKVKKGFFIEAGAFDGEDLSNTLLFELRHQWTGLLVEPNRGAFKTMLGKNRRAWTLPNCFSTKTTPEIVEFDAAGLFGTALLFWSRLVNY